MAGPVEIDPAKPHAFLSYTRFDDDYLDGGISALRKELERAVRARTGAPFNIFQDVEDINLGEAWRQKLDRAIEAAQFFIPILTPNFFTSDFCRREAEAFLAYEARAGRDDLVLPIYLMNTPKLDDVEQRAADDLASRLHERQYDDWRPLRFKLRHDDTRPRIDELGGAIALAIARHGNAATPPPEPTLPTEVMDRLALLEGRLGERDQAIAAEQSLRLQAESELSREKAKSRELAEAPSAFEGQIEETEKQLSAAKAALAEEKAKREKAETGTPSTPRSFYLHGAALALLVGAGGWVAVNGGSSSDIDLLRRQNQELIEQLDARTADLGDAQTAIEDLRALANAAQASDNKVADLSRQVEALSTELANSKEALAAAEALAEAKSGDEKQDIEPLSSFRDCADCPEMVVIPAGSFLMGSPEDEDGRQDNEGPRHGVTIGAPFAIGKFEVTRGEFSNFASATDRQAKGCRYYDGNAWKTDPDRDWRDPGFEQTDSHPAVCVSWEDAQAYTDWLSKETGETYRLPSEAEWEYAARAGTTTRYFWGDDDDSACAFANGHDATSKAQNGFGWTAFPCEDGFARTAPVGSFRANDFGLHDVSGNVWEWSKDSWHSNYDGAPTDGSAWVLGK